MKKSAEKNFDDEIDLKKVFSALWSGKIYIILSVLISVYYASTYLQSQDRLYTVEYKLKPVGETSKPQSLGGLGGFASIAGIKLPSNSNNNFLIFRELITSAEVSEIIFNNKELIKSIYKSEWNESLGSYTQISKSKLQTYKSKIKKFLTGSNINYAPPNPRRFNNFISTRISVKQDDKTGFLTISSETSDPSLMISLIVELTKVSDKIMRQRYIEFSTEPLAFYKEKLRTARAREHRESLAELISNEEQKLMFALMGEYFVAEPFLNPTTSMYPTSPKPKLILLLSLFCGLIIGAGIIFILKLVKED